MSGVKTDTTSNKVILTVRNRASIYDERSLIYDTAATAHLIRNIDLFSGTPVRIDDDDVSFVGFDTDSGHTFAVHRGTLKAPFEGIEAYYVPNCIGNIISEPRFREEFHIADRREVNHRNDTMVSSRKGVREFSPSLKWSRGQEDVFVCDLRQLDRRKDSIMFVLDTKSLKLEETDMVVQSWLLQLGLTNRETIATIAMSRMNRVNREDAIRVCMDGLSMTSHQISSAINRYSEVTVVEENAIVPMLDSYVEMIKSLRTMKITDPEYSQKRKRVESKNIDTCSVDRLPDSGKLMQSVDSIGRLESVQEEEKLTRDNCSLPLNILNHGSVIDMEEASSINNNVTDMATDYTNVGSVCNTARLRSNSVNIDGCNTSEEKKADSSLRSNSVSRSNISEEKKVINVSNSISGEKDDESIRQVGKKRKEINDVNVQTDCLMSLFLSQSKLTLQELMVARLSSDIGLSNEPEIVALSLAQRGLSKSDIKRVAYIERFHKITSFVGLDTLKKMIKYRTVKELDDNLSERDVQNYADYVHEEDCACTEGKMKVHPKPVFDNVAHNPYSCHCDVMHLTTPDKKTKFQFLVGVDAQTQYLFVHPLHDLSEISIKYALKCIVVDYRQNPKQPKLTKIVMDRGGGLNSKATIAALVSLNLDYEYCSTAQHVVLAEAAIKFIKSLVRTTILDSSTKRRFLNSFVPDLVKWVVQSINYSLRSGNDYASPYTRFTDKVVSANIQYRAAFLDIVAVNANLDKASNLDSRAKNLLSYCKG